MTQRASDLLAEVADRLSSDATDSGMVVAEAVRAIEPELLKGYKDGSIDELVGMSVAFLKALFRSLRPDSKLPWPEYYTQAREYARRYAEKGVPLESLMEGLAIFRRTVMARVTDEMGESPYADEVLLLAQSRLGDVVEHLNSMFIRGYLDYTESKYSARQSELRGLYHIASALGRSLDVSEIAEVGLRETLKVLGLQAGAVWVRDGARLKLAKTIGMQPGEEDEFSDSGRSGLMRVLEVSTGPAESRVDRIAGEWSAIRAELRTKGVLLGAMTVATRLPRTFESSDLEFVAAVADQIAVALDRARQHTKEARTDYLTGLANRPEFERAIDRAVASADRHKRRLALMMIDLDNLKDINDTYGHHVGDGAIREPAPEPKPDPDHVPQREGPRRVVLRARHARGRARSPRQGPGSRARRQPPVGTPGRGGGVPGSRRPGRTLERRAANGAHGSDVRHAGPRLRLFHLWHALVPQLRHPRIGCPAGGAGACVGAGSWRWEVRRAGPRDARAQHRPRPEWRSARPARPLRRRRRRAQTPRLRHAACRRPGYGPLGEAPVALRGRLAGLVAPATGPLAGQAPLSLTHSPRGEWGAMASLVGTGPSGPAFPSRRGPARRRPRPCTLPARRPHRAGCCSGWCRCRLRVSRASRPRW